MTNGANVWPLAPAGVCGATDGTYWTGVPKGRASAANIVATATANSTNATATVFYGLKAGTAQPPGAYAARVVYDVIAP